MIPTAIVWPMIAHAALVFGVYVLLLVRRAGAVRLGSALGGFRENREEPAASLAARNNLANQFELPMLFHVVCLALIAVAAVNVVTLAAAWIFIVARYAHALEHVTVNRVPLRLAFFAASVAAAAFLWLWLALRLARLV
jgi:hypothetical protein